MSLSTGRHAESDRQRPGILVPVVIWLICIVLFVMFLKTVTDLVTGDTTSE
ncbi:MAG: hypothetical protein WKF82_03100 [Nocardioidaceae bacterium]